MKDTIFREYDIRGKVGDELKIDEVYDLTCAIASYFFKQNFDIKTIAVGMDGRTHSLLIKDAVCKALQDSGINVIFLGICPSPALYFALHTMSVDGGIMITASHNPKEYNGMKLCLGTRVVWGSQIQEIKRAFRAHEKVSSDKRGTYEEHAIVTPYISWLVHHFHMLKGLPIAAVIDCGNGASGAVIPALVDAMNWKNVHVLFAEVDGNYPNHEANPTVEENMQDVKHALASSDAMIGIGIDGDADRMAPMTKNGTLILGDKLLAIFAHFMAHEHPETPVVFDVKASSGLIEVLEHCGMKPYMSPSGHAYIKEKMRESSALLGGELSCHFFFADRYFGYDDAIYAMLRLFEILNRTGKTLEQLLAIFPSRESTIEFRITYPLDQKDAIIGAVADAFERKHASVMNIDGIRATMPYGWGLIRSSNTQPVMCLRFESDSAEGLSKIKEDFIAVLAPFFGEMQLRKELNG